jgi:hypothetical protein
MERDSIRSFDRTLPVRSNPDQDTSWHREIEALAESGKLRAIAVTSPQRSPAMPDVPTVSEDGLKDFSVVY